MSGRLRARADTAFLAPGDRDVDALLRIAIDAEQRHRDVVMIDTCEAVVE
ncbi:MAG: hypothetical protein M3422_13780 [Actinomycetota bacterium]|nr:hypothetical protein [Actinomycetota bacterium]